MVKKIAIVLGILILILIGAVVVSLIYAQKTSPPDLLANFTDLSKIERISKLRSCSGHVTIPQDGKEPRSSMKHYFQAKSEFLKEKTVPIYAPYDGYVTTLRSDPNHGLQGEIWIKGKDSGPAFLPPMGFWQFSVQHIDVRSDLKRGSEVKAGELIGYAAFGGVENNNQFDIVYGKMGIPPKRIDGWTDPFSDLDSVFNHMSDKVFSDYQTVGATSKDDFIIMREEREQNRCQYQGNGPYFSPQSQGDPNNWFILN